MIIAIIAVSIIIIYVISRVAYNNKIDAFTNMLSMLGIGLLLGIGSYHTVASIKCDQPTQAINITASNPIQDLSQSPVVESVCDSTSLVGQDLLEGDTVVFRAIEEPNKRPLTVELVDDS